ncbi:hypothetical protein D1872_272500 [compost metagenome]
MAADMLFSNILITLSLVDLIDSASSKDLSSNSLASIVNSSSPSKKSTLSLRIEEIFASVSRLGSPLFLSNLP